MATVTVIKPLSHPGVPDPYYGFKVIACLAARFIEHLFGCSERKMPLAKEEQKPPELVCFIAFALHRTRLPENTIFAALLLLHRLKVRFPRANGSSGQRLFICAFMLAAKIHCDNTYSNKSFSIVAQGMFTLRELNQMEREMCSYLEWQLNVDNNVLRDFTFRVQSDFWDPGPNRALASPTKPPSGSDDNYRCTVLGGNTVDASPTIAELQCGAQVDITIASPAASGTSSSASVSPVSIAAPSTPIDDAPGYHVDVAGERRPPRVYSTLEPVGFPHRNGDPSFAAEVAGGRANAILGVPGSIKSILNSSTHPRLQLGRDMFAYATATIW